MLRSTVSSFLILIVVGSLVGLVWAACPKGDLNGDCEVDFRDVQFLVGQWLFPPGSPADIVDGNGVTLADFAKVAENWLKAGTPPVVINEIHSNPDDETELVEFVEIHNAGYKDVDLSGWFFSDGISYAFPPGTILSANGYLIVAENPSHIQTKWDSGGRPVVPPSALFGPYQGRLDNDGEKIALSSAERQVMDEVDYRLGFPWPTVGDPVPATQPGTGHSMQLIHHKLDNDLGGSWRSALPSPAAKNWAVYAENIAPHLRQVRHMPRQPTSNEEAVITIKATDQGGVARVTLEYQVVPAGQYIPAFLPVALDVLQTNPDAPATSNPDYVNPANWTEVAMVDDGTKGDVVAGDSIYTVVLPKQPNRTLVRYRISAQDRAGMEVTGPYPDDPSLNFAYYVYDGVPGYEGFSAEMLCSLPVYHLLTRAEDMHQALGYNPADQIPQFYGGGANPARFVYNWRGTFVYDGVVYDNIKYRLRGANGRYLGGNTKRSMRFRFNRGHYFKAKDMQAEPYPTKWRTLTTAKGFDNRLTLTFALNEHINFFLFNKLGVPAPYSHYFQFRVVDGVEEAPDPWHGDFWGLWFAQETYDVRFLEAHDLEKGNLYKLINSTRDAKQQQRYQALYAVIDGSDHDNIENNLSGYSSADFIRNHVRLDKWYAYHALCQAIRNYDYWPSANKNATWYFEPDYRAENNNLGLMWTLPWDTDASWGPTWNNGHDVVYNSIFPASGGGSDGASTPQLQPDYYNAVREVRDLLWQRDQTEPLIDDFAAPIMDLAEADLRRWLNAPSDAGNYNGLHGPGKNGLPALVQDMKNFAFVGGSWDGGSVGPGGRAAFLDSLADGAEGWMIPDRPSVVYIGEPNFPSNALRFDVSAFSDPQGAYTFEAMKWRIAEVTTGSQVVPQDEDIALIRDGAKWKYFKGTQEPSTVWGAWRQLDFFENSDWLDGTAVIGYGESFIDTQLTDMRGLYSTIYLRKEFTVESLDGIGEVVLEAKYDDGIIIWINDLYAGSGNAPTTQTLHDGTVDNRSENHNFGTIKRLDPDVFLSEGRNIIAAQVINQSLGGSSDCFVDIRLTGESGDDPNLTYASSAGKYEIETIWESEELTPFQYDIQIPASAVKVGHTYRVRCKMQDTSGRWSHWSDPNQFVAGEAISANILDDLRITEVMYNPADANTSKGELNIDNDEFEFVELKNTGDEVLDLTYVTLLLEDTAFDFAGSSVTSLASGRFALVVRNKAAFESRYPTVPSGIIAGQYKDLDEKLGNGGEPITLVDLWNGIIAQFEYDDGRGWPLAPDGGGHSLVPLDSAIPGEPYGSLNYGGNWRPSCYIGGSPGADDPEPPVTVVLNEVMAHTDYNDPAHPEHESNDWIELYNTTAAGVNLAGWYLSDDIDDLKKWAIPPVNISGMGWLSFDEVTGFHTTGSGFGLNKGGDEVILSYLPGDSNDRVVDFVRFKGEENGISLGRYPDGGGYWIHTPPSRDLPNTGGILDIVVDELMYHPVDPNDEYVELYNSSGGRIYLENAVGVWRLDGEEDDDEPLYVFEAGKYIDAGDRLIVVGFDPTDTARLNAFIAAYNTGALTAGVHIVGPWRGNLSNGGERVALERPQAPDLPNPLSWVVVDEVIYSDVSPWPESPDGLGDALQRVHADGYHSGNDPANWQAGPPTPGGSP